MKRSLMFAIALLTVVSCGGQKAKRSTGSDAPLTADSVTIYRPPQPSAMLSDPESRMRWVAEHYWDNFKFADTLAVPRWGDYAEQAFVDMIYALAQGGVPREIADETVTSLFRKAAVNKAAFLKLAEVAEKYLFDPNYPLRNEELYITVLRTVLDNPALDEWERIRPQEQLRLALKNRVGDLAADFRYTLESGATGMLHTLKSPYTLLFFNNPGCPACRETIDQIGASFRTSSRRERSPCWRSTPTPTSRPGESTIPTCRQDGYSLTTPVKRSKPKRCTTSKPYRLFTCSTPTNG